MSHEEIREKIIRAAMKIFSTYGFFKAPVHLIAVEAGVSKGLIFWYFKSKDELILEVAKRSMPIDVFRECLEKNLKGKEILECIGMNYLDKYRDEMMKRLLMHSLASETVYPTIREEIQEICTENLIKVAEKAFGESSIEHIVKARIFFGSLLCYILNPPKNIPEEEYIKLLLKIIYREN